MNYPSDSTYAVQPVGDTGNNASAAFLDQVYPVPPSGTASGDSSISANPTFAPSNTHDLLPSLTLAPETHGDSRANFDPLGQSPSEVNASFSPTEVSAAQTGVNPWDTYVMDPVAETRGTTDAAPEKIDPSQVVPQLEQSLQTQFDEVVKLGTSSDLSTPEAQAQLQTALNDLLETAVKLGAARELTQGVEAVPAESVPAEAMPSEAMPSEAMPSEAMPSEAMPGDSTTSLPEVVAGQTDVAPLDENPYEPQVPPVAPAALGDSTSESLSPAQEQYAATEQPVPAPQPTGTAGDAGLKQDQLKSQVEQILNLAVQAQPNAGNANSGIVDNFKTALLNAVKTAHEIGAQGMAQQSMSGAESSPSSTNMG